MSRDGDEKYADFAYDGGLGPFWQWRGEVKVLACESH